MSVVEPCLLRARFARSLSEMYGREVPAYTTLVDVSREVNVAVAAARGADAERLGSLDRVTAERLLSGFLQRRGYSGDILRTAVSEALRTEGGSGGVTFR